MPRAPAKLQDNGRITIPIEIRQELGVERGDYVLVDVEAIDA